MNEHKFEKHAFSDTSNPKQAAINLKQRLIKKLGEQKEGR